MNHLEIRRIFSQSIHPGNNLLLRPDCRDDSDIVFLYDYQHRPWWEIPDDVMAKNWECIFFLTPAGIRYILPKFIQLSIQGHQSVAEWITSLSSEAHDVYEMASPEEQRIINKYILERCDNQG